MWGIWGRVRGVGWENNNGKSLEGKSNKRWGERWRGERGVSYGKRGRCVVVVVVVWYFSSTLSNCWRNLLSTPTLHPAIPSPDLTQTWSRSRFPYPYSHTNLCSFLSATECSTCNLYRITRNLRPPFRTIRKLYHGKLKRKLFHVTLLFFSSIFIYLLYFFELVIHSYSTNLFKSHFFFSAVRTVIYT